MPCYRPITGYRSSEGKNETTGKIPLVFNPTHAFGARLPQLIPCGRCIGCRQEYSRQWGMRCSFEIMMHKTTSSFITLTYNDDHLPPGETLVPLDFKNFIKRVRYHYGKNIRFFGCGEYGDKYKRPHYHIIFFNLDFPDKSLWKMRTSGTTKAYRSPKLEQIWDKGYSEIGEANFDSACYIARYIIKKINVSSKTPENLKYTYDIIDKQTGEVTGIRQPEFLRMSLKPGIGLSYFEKFHKSIYPQDTVHLRGGIKLKPPRYYDKLIEIKEPEMFKMLTKKRRKEGLLHKGDQTDYRLRVREAVKNKQFNLLVRPIEREQNK